MPKFDKEEGDSNGEVGSADSVEEPTKDHISTGKDKKEDKESKKGQEVEEDKKVNATKVEAAAKHKKEEKKEAKASTSNAVKHGKEKVSEEVKGPTKDELHAAISKLLEEANLVQISPADIPQQLGVLFEVDLTDRKEEVLQIIDDVINSKLFKPHGIPVIQKWIISVKKFC